MHSKVFGGLWIILLLWVGPIVASCVKSLGYEDALMAKSVGDYVRAEECLKSLIQDNDNCAELWFQLGLVQRFQGKMHLARISQNKAITLSPHDLDIRLEIARQLYWDGAIKESTTIVDDVLRIKPFYADAMELKAMIQASQSQTKKVSLPLRLDFGREFPISSNTSQIGVVRSFAQLHCWCSPKTGVHLRTEDARQNNVYSRCYEMGVTHLFNYDHNANFSLGYTPTLDAPLQWCIKAGTESKLCDSVRLTSNIQRVLHKAYNITAIKPGIVVDCTNVLQMQFQYIMVFNKYTYCSDGWSIRADIQPSLPDFHFYGGFTIVPEVSSNAMIRIRTTFVGTSYNFSDNLILHTSYGQSTYKQSPIRHFVATALSIKFNV